MSINPNTEIPLCFTYIVDTTVTIAFVNHVGFVDVFVLQIEKGLNFPCQPNHLEDITVPSKTVQFVYKFGTCFLVSRFLVSFVKLFPVCCAPSPASSL